MWGGEGCGKESFRLVTVKDSNIFRSLHIIMPFIFHIRMFCTAEVMTLIDVDKSISFDICRDLKYHYNK
jgi:hypothetical protein